MSYYQSIPAGIQFSEKVECQKQGGCLARQPYIQTGDFRQSFQPVLECVLVNE